jgi:hypothetical protein
MEPNNTVTTTQLTDALRQTARRACVRMIESLCVDIGIDNPLNPALTYSYEECVALLAGIVRSYGVRRYKDGQDSCQPPPPSEVELQIQAWDKIHDIHAPQMAVMYASGECTRCGGKRRINSFRHGHKMRVVYHCINCGLEQQTTAKGGAKL